MWHNRNRDPSNQDPRDQEIRELSATLSIARKELAKAAEEKNGTQSKSSELQEKLQHMGAALADIQQKFNATKDHLNKEIEQKEELLEEVRQLRRDLDRAQAHVAELEIQAKMSSHGSGMVAGMDMIGEDDGALQEMRERTTQLNSEVERWKQHCTVMSKTNKALRAQVANLTQELDNALSQTNANNTDALPVLEAAQETTEHVAQQNGGNEALRKDDLQSIRGVGEKLEQKLNLLGIFSFSELLSVDTATLERANLVIPNLAQRIERESWCDQARALHLQKYNEVL